MRHSLPDAPRYWASGAKVWTAWPDDPVDTVARMGDADASSLLFLLTRTARLAAGGIDPEVFSFALSQGRALCDAMEAARPDTTTLREGESEWPNL